MVKSTQDWTVEKDKKRARTQRKSCDTCHKSKTRCDRKRPVCSTCHIFGRTCTYLHRDKHGAASLSDEESSSHTHPSLTSNTSIDTESSENPSEDSSESRHISLTQVKAISGSIGSPNKRIKPSPTEHAGNEQDRDLTTSLDSNQLQTFHFGTQFRPCGWCMEASCAYCNELALTLTDDVDVMATDTFMPSDKTSAQFILGSMTTMSDHDSSTILAAIRMGTPWNIIRGAITAANCSTSSLGHILEQHHFDASSSSTRYVGETLPNPTLASLKDTTRQVWAQLNYELIAPSKGDSLDELKGLMKHTKQKSLPPTLPRSASRDSDAAVDIHLPVWALLPSHSITKAGDPFDRAFIQMKTEIAAGADIERYCGQHPHLGALFHPEHAKRAPRLTQIITELLKNLLLDDDEPSVTLLAVVWVHFYLWKWMLKPTRDNYEKIPKTMKPAPWQLHQPHTLVYDFILSPALRERLCRSPLTNNAWISEAARTIKCHWPKTPLYAVYRNPITKEMDLHPDCQTCAAEPENWSFGPSVRAHLPDVDQYITIRSSVEM